MLHLNTDGKQKMQPFMVVKLQDDSVVACQIVNMKYVTRFESLKKLRCHHPANLGLAPIEGHWVPIIDLSHALNQIPMKHPTSGFVILTEFHQSLQGILVSEIVGMFKTRLEAVHAFPTCFADLEPYSKAWTFFQRKWIEVIDLAHIVFDVYDYPLNDTESSHFSQFSDLI